MLIRTIGLLFVLVCVNISFAQCPSVAVDAGKTNFTYEVDNFAKLIANAPQSGPQLLAATYIDVTSPAGCEFDLYARAIALGPSYYSQNAPPSAIQGSEIDETDILIRAVNACATSDEIAPAPVTPISNTAFTALSGFNQYIIGSAAIDGVLASTTCGGDNINDDGSGTLNPTTHRFRIDLEFDFSRFTDAGLPNDRDRVITPGFYTFQIIFGVTQDDQVIGGELIDVYNLSIDVKPLLQLKMNSSDNIEFNFSNAMDYRSGEIKYNSTILEVISNMNWDLFAVGTSLRYEADVNEPFWDILGLYSTSSGDSDVPLSSLELFQTPQNPLNIIPGTVSDYNTALAVPPSGNNNITVARGSSASPAPDLSFLNTQRTIAGNWGNTALANSIESGSYMLPNAAWSPSNFRYAISYRITPGLPATFGNGLPAMTNYASPGRYSMQVRYLLTEDQ